MPFSSHLFIFAFLPLAVLGYRLTRGSGRADLWLIAASIIFYYYAGVVATVAVLVSAAGNYLLSIALTRLSGRARSLVLATAITGNLLILGYFKYFAFILTSLAVSLHVDVRMADVPLPLGISFFTFQQIAYLIDAHFGKAPVPRFRHYLLFVTFFPQASSGPINYWHETIPQYERIGLSRRFALDVSVGLTLFTFGLFKKTVLSSSLAQFVDPVFDGPANSLTFLDAWTAALAYALQLYFDFSGYSDMAIGIGRMFGVRLPINFFSPLRAVNLVDFWRRWHMTMTRFFTDYVYSPLALRWMRQSMLRRDRRALQFLHGVALPTAITFLLIGWWHGPNPTFVLFGAIQAVGLIVNQAWRQLKWPAPPRPLGLAVTFSFFVVSTVVFRAPTVDHARSIYRTMAGASVESMNALIALLRNGWRMPASQGSDLFPGLAIVSRLTHAPELLVYLFALVLICTTMPNTAQILSRYRPALTTLYRDYAGRLSWRPNLGWSIVVAAMLGFAILNLSHVKPFIYVQF